MRTSVEVFANENIQCLKTTKHIFNDPEIRERIRDERFRYLIDEIFDLLLNESIDVLRRSIIECVQFLQREQGTVERRDGFDLLYHELVFFNNRFGDTIIEPIVEHRDISKEKVETADVVLGSVNKLLSKLPKWLQNVIEVLREALGIAKAFM